MRVRTLAGAALIAALTLASCRTTTDAKTRQRLDALFTDLHQRGMFDGAVVVGRGEAILWEKGFGEANGERGVAFTPDTPSDGASLAKTFTAAVVLMLQSEGVLSLDVPVQRYLPELPYPTITLRHLLSHTSGLAVLDYDWFDPYLPPGRARTTEALLEVVGAQKPALVAEPGTMFEYSSFGYDLAALAAARAAKTTFADLLQTRIFRPLGIASAFLRPARFEDFPGVRTLGYRTVGGKREVRDVFNGEAFHGGSNIYISARDLHRWNASFLTHPHLAHAALADVSTPARVNGAQSALTLGNWYRSADGRKFWYSGHLQGFHDEVFRDLDRGDSIVYMSNNTMEPWLHRAIVRAVSNVLEGRSQAPLLPPPTETVSHDERGALQGEWVFPEGDRFSIALAPPRFQLVRDGVSYRIVQVHPTTFYVPGLDWQLGFARDSSGGIARVYVSTNVDERWGTRR
jgi:N-acyl-D-amino-acid deacylase